MARPKRNTPPPPKAPKQTNRTPATEAEKGLSSALITSALGLLAAFLWASFGVIDKVTPLGFWILLGIGGLATILLIASVVFGGIGITQGVTKGVGNSFDKQAKTGLLAILILLGGPVAALTCRSDEASELSQKMRQLDARIQTLDQTLVTTNAQIQTRMNLQDARLDQLQASQRESRR